MRNYGYNKIEEFGSKIDFGNSKNWTLDGRKKFDKWEN